MEFVKLLTEIPVISFHSYSPNKLLCMLKFLMFCFKIWLVFIYEIVCLEGKAGSLLYSQISSADFGVPPWARLERKFNSKITDWKGLWGSSTVLGAMETASSESCLLHQSRRFVSRKDLTVWIIRVVGRAEGSVRIVFFLIRPGILQFSVRKVSSSIQLLSQTEAGHPPAWPPTSCPIFMLLWHILA